MWKFFTKFDDFTINAEHNIDLFSTFLTCSALMDKEVAVKLAESFSVCRDMYDWCLQ